MRLKVIGSGDLWSSSNSACYLVDDKILIDMPNGTYKALLRNNVKPQNIDNILITHFHGDHYFDVPFIMLSKVNKKGKLNIALNKTGKKKIKKLFKLAFPNSKKKVKENVEVNYYYEDNFKIDDYKISKYLVKHGHMKKSYGYIIDYDNKKVGFTGDSAYCDTVKFMASICNYLVCDTTYINGNKSHMGIDNVMNLADTYKNCTFLLSHLSEKSRKKLKNVNIENVKVCSDKSEFIL